MYNRNFLENGDEFKDKSFELIEKVLFSVFLYLGVNLLTVLFVQIIELNIIVPDHRAILSVEEVSFFSELTSIQIVD